MQERKTLLPALDLTRIDPATVSVEAPAGAWSLRAAKVAGRIAIVATAARTTAATTDIAPAATRQPVPEVLTAAGAASTADATPHAAIVHLGRTGGPARAAAVATAAAAAASPTAPVTTAAAPGGTLPVATAAAGSTAAAPDGATASTAPATCAARSSTAVGEVAPAAPVRAADRDDVARQLVVAGRSGRLGAARFERQEIVHMQRGRTRRVGRAGPEQIPTGGGCARKSTPAQWCC
uniref:Uncharacterized protein n=1 Tax=Anopheles merus TaxID=30066 RepID=A0A182VE65_ANOME